MAYPNGGLHAAGNYAPSNPERLAAARADVLSLANNRRAPHDAVNLCLEETVYVSEGSESQVHRLVQAVERRMAEPEARALAKSSLATSIPIIRALELGFTACHGDWNAVREADDQFNEAQDWIAAESGCERAMPSLDARYYIEPNVTDVHGYVNLRVQQEVYRTQTHAVLPRKISDYTAPDAIGESNMGDKIALKTRQHLRLARIASVGYRRAEFVVDLGQATHQGGGLWDEIHDICVESEQTRTLLRLDDATCNVSVHTGDQARELRSHKSMRVLRRTLGKYASNMLSPVAVTYFHTNTIEAEAPIEDAAACADFGLTAEDLHRAYTFGVYLPDGLVAADALAT